MAYVLGHYKHFIKNHVKTRIFARFRSSRPIRKIIPRQKLMTEYSSYFSEQFDTMFSSLSLLKTEWASVQDSRPYARFLYYIAYMGKNMPIKSPLMWIRTANFFPYLDRVWVGDMISYLIWTLSLSWRHHNGLGSQNTKMHIMTSLYLCKN